MFGCFTTVLSVYLHTMFPDYKTHVLDAGKSVCVDVPQGGGSDVAFKFSEENIIYDTSASHRCEFF